MLKEYDLKETIVNYLCPRCGAKMTSGIQHPEGDYDDRLIKPHCLSCEWEPNSNKSPFAECVPEVFMPERRCAYLMVYRGGHDHEILLYNPDIRKPAYSTLEWGFGGSIYADAVWSEVDGAVERLPGETDDQFNERSQAYFEQMAG